MSTHDINGKPEMLSAAAQWAGCELNLTNQTIFNGSFERQSWEMRQFYPQNDSNISKEHQKITFDKAEVACCSNL